MIKILVISDTDSRKSWSNLLIKSLEEFYEPILVDYIDYNDFICFFSGILDGRIALSKLIVIALGGGANLKVIQRVRSSLKRNDNIYRPIIITGFNGIINPHSSMNALNCRIGSDIVCVNTVYDYKVFNTYLKEINYQQSPLLLLGFLQNLNSMNVNFFDQYQNYEKKLIFIVQPDVPKSLTERFYVIEKFVELAKRHPSWGIFIKARSKIGDTNITHHERHRYEYIYGCFNQLDNVHFIYGDMTSILDGLDKKDVVLSIGSTVIMHCLQKGINVGVISDFGVREDYGTEHFVGSHIFIELSDIDECIEKKLLPNNIWLDKYFDKNQDGVIALYNRIQCLAGNQQKNGKMLPFNPVIYSEDFAKYLNSGYSIKKSDRKKFKLRKRFYNIFSFFHE